MALSAFGGNLSLPDLTNLSFSSTSALAPSLAMGNTLGSANTVATTQGAAAAARAAEQAAEAPIQEPPVPLGGNSNERWTFIVAPEDISWDTAVAVNRVDMFGTNAPPVIVGTKGMRDLSLTNALIEGFTRARTVEGRLLALEKLMRFTINSQGGFVNVPVYHVYANQKKYGGVDPGEGGYFVIKDVKVKETMRDFDGLATRAFADISLVQVPAYQVDLGIDQASAKVNKATSYLAKLEPILQQQAQQATTAPAGSLAPRPAPTPRPAAPSRPSGAPAGGTGTSGGGSPGVTSTDPTQRIRLR